MAGSGTGRVPPARRPGEVSAPVSLAEIVARLRRARGAYVERPVLWVRVSPPR